MRAKVEKSVFSVFFLSETYVGSLAKALCRVSLLDVDSESSWHHRSDLQTERAEFLFQASPGDR